MSDDAKREGLSDERCDDIALDARERVRGMAAWGMHLDRALIRAGYALAAPASAQTPAGEALREAIEWAETVLCALQPTEQVRMRVLIAAALASQSSARPQEGADTAAKVADALAELVACLAEQAAIPYGRTPDEAERAFNRRRANERRTERALTGGREALAAYLARPSCTYPACRCEGPGPDGGCGSAAIPSPDGAAG